MSDVCDIFAHRRKLEEKKELTDELADSFAREEGVSARPQETLDEIDSRGAFVRQANTFTQKFGVKDDELHAAPNKYRIYWKYGCHWSNRPVIVRDILGLEDVISDIALFPASKYGHGFPYEKDFKDPVTGVHFLSTLYKNAKPDYKGRATTPTLVDIDKKIAVNNDYHRMTNYIETYFYPYQKTDIDLYPKAYRKEIDEFNDWLFPYINNAHYRMAFCQSPEAYKEAYDDFYYALDKLEERLENNRFLFGDFILDSDVRLYVTLVRWELTYFHNVGPMKKRVSEYKNIWGYVKELYSIEAFHKYTVTLFPKEGEVNSDKGFFRPYIERIVPKINYDILWKTDGERRKISSTDEIYLKHKEKNFPEYYSDISVSFWNDPSWDVRDSRNPRRELEIDPKINPLKGKLSN